MRCGYHERKHEPNAIDVPYTPDELSRLHGAAARGDYAEVGQIVERAAERALVAAELVETTQTSVENAKALAGILRASTTTITVEIGADMTRREKVGCLLALAGLLAAEEQTEREGACDD